jgi:hypothetical protein
MKIAIKAIIAAGLAILVILALPILYFLYGMAMWSYEDGKQMTTGRKYMDSLSDKDIQAWIQRTQKYLAEYPPTNFDVGLDSNSIPPDLQKLGMRVIEVLPGEVDYLWLAGMDGTGLAVLQMSNRTFQVTAVYTPYSSRVIWPKQ